MKTLTIWCNAGLPDYAQKLLSEGTQPHRLVMDRGQSSNLVASGASQLLEEADVAFGQPDPVQVRDISQLQWVQLTSAGYTRYDRPDVKRALSDRSATLTNSSSVYADPCAQHALAFMLTQARQIPASFREQDGEKGWCTELFRPATVRLHDQTVLLVGYGAIGRRLTQLLAPFPLTLQGLRRSPTGQEPIPTRSIDHLDSLLPTADYVINLLPQTSDNDHLFNEPRFSLMKPGAIFINIGRGTTVDQTALANALNTGHVGSAYLDVTDPEPLPPSHPLWTTRNCVITPHTAGGFQEEHGALVKHFLANLDRFETSEELFDRVL